MAASGDGVPVFKFPGWRRKGVVKEEVRCRYILIYCVDILYRYMYVDIDMFILCGSIV